MSRCGRPRTFVASIGVVSGAVQLASAEEPTPLVWSAPPECPTVEEVARGVTHLAGDVSAWPPDSPTFKAVVERDGDQYHLTLSRADAGGDASRVRRASAVSCEDLAELTVLGVALLVDPAAVQRSTDADGTPAGGTAAALEAEPTPSPTGPSEEPGRVRQKHATPGSDVEKDDVRHTSERASVSLSLGPFGAVVVGALPSPAPGVGLRASVELVESVRVEGLGAYFFEQTHAPDSGVAEAEFSLIAGGARGCYLAGVLRPLAICSGIEVGAVRSAGVGISSPNRSAGRWLAPHVGPAAIIPFGRTRILLSTDVLFPLWSEGFVVRRDGREYVVHEIPPWAFRGALGVELVVD